MIQFKVTAPAKVILYGEHAVVHGRTAVAASLGLHTTIEFSELLDLEGVVKIFFPKINLAINVSVQQIESFMLANKAQDIIENFDTFYNAIKEFVNTIGYNSVQQKFSLEAFFYLLIYTMCKENGKLRPFQLNLSTEVSISSGLGSSASFAVCLAACFLHWSHLQNDIYKPFDSHDLETISKYAFKCEVIMHGTPSGLDNSICTYGSIIEYRKGEPVKLISGVQSMKVLLVDTRVSRSTKLLVDNLMELKRTYPVITDFIFDAIDTISKTALKAMQKIKDLPESDNESLIEGYKQLMTLINMNQGLLTTLQASHPSLDRICAQAQNYGLAAKLTGAGGGGYAYILLLPDTQPETISSISRKLIADGYIVSLTSLGCPGVQIHD